MRIGYVVAMAAFLAGTPAMAEVVIGTGDNDSTRHEYRAEEDRAAGHQEMNEARQKAAVGEFRGAAHEQAEARQDWHAAHHEQHDADRDSNGGVTVQLGH